MAALAAAGLAVGGGAVSRLSSGGFGADSFESRRAERLVERATGEDPERRVLAIVRTPEGALSLRGAAAVAAARARLGLPVTRVVPALDGRSALLVVPNVGDARAARLERRFRGDPRVLLGGTPVASAQIDGIVREDLRRAELVALPLVLVLSLVVFGGLVAALLPPLVGAVAIAGALAGLRAATEVADVSIYALNLVTGMCLGLAIDYSLFVVSRYREELARGREGLDALRATLATAGRTVVFSALTVAGALAALLVFPLGFLRSMGFGGVLAALFAALVSLTLLPAALALLGPRVNSLSPRPLRRLVEARSRPAERGFWYRLAQLVMRRPLPVALATGALLVALGLPFLRVQVTTVDASVLPRGESAREVAEALAADYPAALARQAYVAVRAPASARPAVERLADRLRAQASGAQIGAPAYLGRSTWRLDVGVSGGRAASERAVRQLRAAAAPFPALVGGRAAFLVDQKASLGAHIPWAILVVAATTLAALFLMTGSVVLPLKAIVLNLLTLAAVFGAMVLVFQDGHLQGLLGFESQGALDTTQPLLVAAFAFGLSTDYGIFLLTRIKEARDRGADDRTAIAAGLERTGRLVTAAALLFVVAIGAFAASRVVVLKQIGVGSALAVAIDATIVRALLVPSLMRLLGRWNWWAPRPLARLHERLGVREH